MAPSESTAAKRGLTGAIEKVSKASAAVKAMRATANTEPEPEPPPPVSDGPAAAGKSSISGVGMHTAIARQNASFIIHAFDDEGIRIDKGGELFMVAVRGSALVKARVTDSGDGTYLCEYRPSVSGQFTISVSLGGVPLAGSPFPLAVLQPRPDPPKCLVHGPGLHKAVARERTEFFVEFVDKLGQVTHAEDLDVWVELLDASRTAFEDVTPAPAEAKAGGSDADATAPAPDSDLTAASDGAVDAGAPSAAPPADADGKLADGSSTAGAPAPAAIPYIKLEAGERQQHLSLWARRQAADKTIAVAVARAARAAEKNDEVKRTGKGARAATGILDGVGTNLSHELLLDRSGIGFAFGGVAPGTLHAKGQLVKVHTVHLSIGLAGKYRLHVGLRQQQTFLPGSPFSLTVLPGGAYAPSTRIPRSMPPHGESGATTRDGVTRRDEATSRLAAVDGGNGGLAARAPPSGSPNREHTKELPKELGSALVVRGGGFGGVVGSEWHGVRMEASDKMGNPCNTGGAKVKVEAKMERGQAGSPGGGHGGGGHGSSHGGSAGEGKGGGSSGTLETRCVDHGDGTYMLGWRAEVSGHYMMHITIGGQHVVGSPCPIIMLGAEPEIAACEVSGAGLTKAVAGRPAVVRVRLRDKFHNAALAAGHMKFGLSMNSLDAQTQAVKKPKGEAKKGKGGGDDDAEEAPRRKERVSREAVESIEFEGSWVGDEYEMRYLAKEAGNFELNIWSVLREGGIGSSSSSDAPEAVRVGGGALAVEGARRGSVVAAVDTSNREKLPGSPFVLHVAEGKPHASQSYIEGDEAASKETISAGERFAVRVNTRDSFLNAAAAPEGALVATLKSPEGETALSLKPRHGLGEYELLYDPHLKGPHIVHVRLDGADLAGSPISLECAPSAPVAIKSRLHPPSEPTVTHNTSTMVIELFDRFGNRVERGGSRVDARALGPSAGQCAVEDLKDGTYEVSFSAFAVGDYKVTARLENKDELAPLSLYFNEGRPKPKAEEAAPAPAAAPSAASKANAKPPAAPKGRVALSEEVTAGADESSSPSTSPPQIRPNAKSTAGKPAAAAVTTQPPTQPLPTTSPPQSPAKKPTKASSPSTSPSQHGRSSSPGNVSPGNGSPTPAGVASGEPLLELIETSPIGGTEFAHLYIQPSDGAPAAEEAPVPSAKSPAKKKKASGTAKAKDGSATAKAGKSPGGAKGKSDGKSGDGKGKAGGAKPKTVRKSKEGKTAAVEAEHAPAAAETGRSDGKPGKRIKSARFSKDPIDKRAAPLPSQRPLDSPLPSVLRPSKLEIGEDEDMVEFIYVPPEDNEDIMEAEIDAIEEEAAEMEARAVELEISALQAEVDAEYAEILLAAESQSPIAEKPIARRASVEAEGEAKAKPAKKKGAKGDTKKPPKASAGKDPAKMPTGGVAADSSRPPSSPKKPTGKKAPKATALDDAQKPPLQEPMEAAPLLPPSPTPAPTVNDEPLTPAPVEAVDEPAAEAPRPVEDNWDGERIPTKVPTARGVKDLRAKMLMRGF